MKRPLLLGGGHAHIKVLADLGARRLDGWDVHLDVEATLFRGRPDVVDADLADYFGSIGKLKLTVNEEKTRICKVPQEQFDFPGYTFGRLYSKTTGKARLGLWPSKKSIRRMVEEVHVAMRRTRRAE